MGREFESPQAYQPVPFARENLNPQQILVRDGAPYEIRQNRGKFPHNPLKMRVMNRMASIY